MILLNYEEISLHSGNISSFFRHYGLLFQIRAELWVPNLNHNDTWQSEWPSGPASPTSVAEVKNDCVRSETGWATFQMNDQNATVLWKGR